MTRQGQEPPADPLAKAEDFAMIVTRIVEAECVVNTFNANQTAAFYEMLPKKTLAPTGAKTAWAAYAVKDQDFERQAAPKLTGSLKGATCPSSLRVRDRYYFRVGGTEASECYTWVGDAWNDIPATVVMSGSRKCHIGEAGTTDVTGEEESDEIEQLVLNAVPDDLESLVYADEVVRQEADVVCRICSGSLEA
ncbi:unnamed protein product [Phytophthora fragariaefolia]|uniref:Unnamed protein product n=1 Tax=Phytophthora fragariaefolia TaxID=1490495 RepID=A0A9W6WU98_9STRA|nr:unnamed protein product [Phytophthora fragariaefolia]